MILRNFRVVLARLQGVRLLRATVDRPDDPCHDRRHQTRGCSSLSKISFGFALTQFISGHGLSIGTVRPNSESFELDDMLDAFPIVGVEGCAILRAMKGAL